MKGSIANPGVGPHVQQTLQAYQEHAALDTFYTTLHFNKLSYFNKFISNYLPSIASQLQRRQLKIEERISVKSINNYEIARIISNKILPPTVTDFIWEWGELAFDRWVAQQLNNQIKWIHCYEHCSYATIQQAKKLNLVSFYEQPSQHYSFFEKVAKEQLKKFQELNNAETILLVDQKAERRNKRRNLELNTCDYIICNSTFTAKTLIAANLHPAKIITIPLAFPEPLKTIGKKSIPAKTVFVYAGNQSLRKGTHILFKAWQKCNFKEQVAELWLIGSSQLPIAVRAGLGAEVKFIPNLPQNELMQVFTQVDILILPTLCDGFGMVITEAMAQGLPVITTYNSGGPDVMTNGKEGFLLEAGNLEQLAAKLKWCVENKTQLQQMGENALVKAASYPWKNFRKKLMQEITCRIDHTSN